VNHPDPLKVTTTTIELGVFDSDEVLARRVLDALKEAGWHLVRIDPCPGDDT
jgi:hypothetical protein